MTVERITVSLPAAIRADVQQAADDAGIPLSTAVAEALSSWLRHQHLGTWLAEYQAGHGAFTEDELRALAEEKGVPYVPPRRKRSAA